MSWLHLPPMPGLTIFMFALCGFILIVGIPAILVERRKEIRKKKARRQPYPSKDQNSH